MRPSSPSNVALMNGGSSTPATVPQAKPSQTSPGGFVAVNARPPHESHSNGASSSTRHELLSKFHTVHERRPSSQASSCPTDGRRPSSTGHAVSHTSPPATQAPRALSKPTEAPPANVHRPSHLSESELHSLMNSPVPIPNTPSNLLPAASQRNSQPQEKDDGGPFKMEMVLRMESLAKGERILPPCDRCRRLHMDCLKNLTACMGCTKKHAKCSWKEVREGELRSNYAHPSGTNSNMHSETSDHESGDRASTASPAGMLSPSRHGLASSHMGSSNGGHTPQPMPHHPAPAQNEYPQGEHLRPPVQSEPRPQQHPHYEVPHDGRASQSRQSPPERDRNRETERKVEAQLQEAAQSSLAHANGNARAGAADNKGSEYHPTMVA